jgi:hypothetical protein
MAVLVVVVVVLVVVARTLAGQETPLVQLQVRATMVALALVHLQLLVEEEAAVLMRQVPMVQALLAAMVVLVLLHQFQAHLLHTLVAVVVE